MLRALGASSICLGIAACGGSSDAAVTTPSANTSACGNALNLGVNQSAVLQCAGGTTVQLTGNGATYLIVPNLAAGSAPDTAVTYTLTVTGAAATAAAAAVGDRVNASPVPGTVRLAAPPRAAQAHFDLALRARERRALRQGAWRVAATA
ncbi:MAG TPA: hypothetical protein VG818_09800, partial [Gemmatimonadaceae bacterium]|nr:hypothetical protein [Gemmatimonadaceae bacterium]